VQWSPDVATFIANGLSPAKVLNVILQDDNDGRTAAVVVPDKQLSLAIGKEGQNARLAAKLTGWRIDIKSATEAAEEALRKAFEQEPVRQATDQSRDILSIAEEILKEKEGVALSDGELQALSQAIQVVDQAEAVLEMERASAQAQAETETAELEPTLTETETVDLLAKAEALLAAKDKVLEEAEVEPEGVVAEEPLAEEEAAVEAPTTEVAPTEVIEAEPIEAEESVAPEVVETVADAREDSAEAEAVPEVEIEPELPEQEPEPDIYLEWVEGDEEEGDEDVSERRKAKKKSRRKKRQLVFDEDLGEVVSRRRRKPGRRREDWENY
jgi:N utilization substance protein A